MPHLEAIRRLAAYAWVAAGILFHLGLSLDTTEVRPAWAAGRNAPIARRASSSSPVACVPFRT